ncbi:MAG: FG-GAP-like repeat-containing protein [Planctomycetota bacterium]|nr:FG-GAP-like repeat-containing protein [Planctomycetota bacterium]
MSRRALPIGLACLIVVAGAILVGIMWKPNIGTAVPEPGEDSQAAPGDVEFPREPDDQLLQKAGEAFQRRDFRTAEELAAGVPESSEWATTAYRLAGEAAAYQDRFDAAIAHFDQMTDDRHPDFLLGNVIASDILLNQQYRMSEAEDRLRLVLEIAPQDADANLAMYLLLSSCARRREMVPHILAAMRGGRFRLDQLLALTGEPRLYSPPPLLQRCHATEPEYVGVLVGMAQAAMNQGETKRARELLEKIVTIEPGFLPAQSRLGALILQESRGEEFLSWHGRLPSESDQDPDIWLLRGDWATQTGQRRAAIRCYWEAARRDPNLRPAVLQLSKLLAAQGDDDRARPFVIRSQNLQRLKEQEARLNREGPTPAVILEIATQMDKLGRAWETWGWCRAALEQNPDLAWAQRKAIALEDVLRQNPPQTLASANPAGQVDLSELPLPDWTALPSNPQAIDPSRVAHGTIAFKNVAVQAGLEFAYFNDPSPPGQGRKMYEYTGGGAAILDFDADGWPDIYLAQGCAWPPREDVHEHLDRMFQNRADGTVMDVTVEAGLSENSFSQGVAVGDFDNDGFADLMIGNIGRNRLYRNNGDGTFHDVTMIAGLNRADWTTSCAICDVNGDGLPDLYAVNYLQGDDIYELVCKNRDGRPQMCSPTSFEAAQDRLHLNLGDGRFEDVTDQAGIRAAGGKGLGVVAADFEGSGKLSLFVANDGRANFYFQNQAPRGEAPVFSEQAYLKGLAFNGSGLSEACMGVAIGDCDGDQHLDLFVTNFYSETNTLYRQNDAFFDDATRQAGLETESTAMLGFGTQFLDADLNGHLDLIVTNGHIDDLRDEGTPYQMPPQFFRNEGGNSFRLLPAESLGAYFEGNYLGRGLARLDWNRDGREDVVVSHLDAPVALLENTTEESGHGLVIRLRGTLSDRDAIGTTVTADAGGSVFLHQLTAGDGYLASNQRIVVLGLAASTSIDRLRVRWPSGREQEFADVQADGEVVIIEGQSELVRISSKTVFSPRQVHVTAR